MSVNNKAIFILGFVGLVFSFSNLEFGYEVGKTIWLQWWVRVLTISLLISILKNKARVKLKPLSKRVYLSLALFLIAALIAAALGVDWQQSLWGNYYRGDGLLTWLHIITLSFLPSWIFSKKEMKQILPTAASAAGLLLLTKIVFPNFMNWVAIGFGNANIEAGFLVIITPLILFGLRKLHWGFVGVSFLAILVTTIYLQAWGSVVSLILGLIMYYALSIKGLRKWTVAIPVAALIVGVMGLMFQQPVANSRFTESRMRIFHKLGRAVWQRPVLGWGWANVDAAFESIDWPVAVQKDAYVDNAHAQLLEFAIAGGLVGLSIYLLFLSGVYREAINSLKIDDEWGKSLLLVCLLYFFHSQTNVVSVAESAVFWISLGLLLD
ncbi:MAG: O-antigen ligase family protein [Candidatus Pacebacteria bacterium]|jgi:O-antigen ligase|nr:O-antigen ligase family protein [Candidatus Paceibacterota bacterium]MBT3512238.1 O-antigen ligase family protein [Candidatus Paceibacterota bacterium]MBT4004848.1 O-antigen ligase family protein [Candidatus Paceibacterota bacterium]MBT4359316.1 O-antigen ligase family protein [Candidatus Paceibacterota bacterium]MBT4680933.1 O-antigen ligase family protein [Candidatus Paceibacterota bacterium]